MANPYTTAITHTNIGIPVNLPTASPSNFSVRVLSFFFLRTVTADAISHTRSYLCDTMIPSMVSPYFFSNSYI